MDVTVFRDDGSGTFTWYDWFETNATGHYSVTTLPAGTYRLGFNAWTGSLGPEFYDDATSLATATDIPVAEGAAVVGKDVTLDPAAHITGTVTGSGNPVRFVEVVAYADADGDGEWEYVGEDYTDFDGTYDLDGLGGGTYRLRFYDYSDDFVSEWYDDAADLETADDVTVAKSQTVSGIDADLSPTSHITGVVTGPGGAPLADIGVTVYAHVDGDWEYQSSDDTDASGAYDVGGLEAGSYRVGFRGWDGLHAPEYYDDRADLSSSDPVAVGVSATTSGINASLATASRITGRVTKMSGLGVDDGEVTVYRLEGGVFEYFDSFYTDGAGNYNAGGLNAGTYRVEFYDWDTDLIEYWNDKSSLQTADDIVLASGQVAGNINATLGSIVANTTLPTITGTPYVGQPLTASPGTWSPAGVTVAYQWLANGAGIVGATARTYVPTAADVGKSIRVRVFASYLGYWTGIANSLATAPVAGPTPPPTAIANARLPKIKGTLEVGRTVKVTEGSWKPSTVSLKYQWYAGGKKIKKATKSKLTLSTKQVGKKLTVKVTASAPGYTTTTVRTKPSARVKP